MDEVWKGSGGDDPELDNFLSRVNEISKILEGLASEDAKEQERAIRQADILLHDGSGEGPSQDQHEPTSSTTVTSDRTIINKSPPADPGPAGGDVGQDQAAFMRMVEKDAAERAKDRQERKKESDKFRAKGNDGFKRQCYAEALDNYNKAIELVKDSPCLYMNRALTYIRVGVPTKALDDLRLALDLNPRSLKARLLKARALFNLSDPEGCREWLAETRADHPGNLEMINRYEEDLFELRMELNEAYNGEKKAKTGEEGHEQQKKKKKKGAPAEQMKKRLHEICEPERVWLKAIRGELETDGESDTGTEDLEEE